MIFKGVFIFCGQEKIQTERSTEILKQEDGEHLRPILNSIRIRMENLTAWISVRVIINMMNINLRISMRYP